MKRRMEQLINGRFEYEVPKLILSDQEITVKVKTGEEYRGELYVGAEDNRRFKGMVMSSDRRIILAKEKFAGMTVCIPYVIEVKGLRPGDTFSGEITINSNLGEYQIKIHVQVEEEQICTTLGEIHTLDEFVKLAEEDDREAFRIFTSDKFNRLLQGENEKYTTLYRGFSQNPVTYQHMEEFLVAAGKKEPLDIRLEEQSREFVNVPYTMKEKFQIIKNTWGYLRVELEAKGDFLSLEKDVITQDDFIGSVCNIEYLVRKDKLGKGIQYGEIVLKTVYGAKTYQVTVSGEDPYDISTFITEKNSVINIARGYEKYRLGDAALEEWLELTEKELNKLQNIGAYFARHQMLEAYAALKKDDKEQAAEILKKINKGQLDKENMEEEGMYLALSLKADLIKERKINSVHERLGNLFRMNPGSRIFLEIMMSIHPEYRTSSTRQLYMMEQVYEMGCNSPFLYLDAYEVLKSDESSLRKITPFLITVMAYVADHGKLTKEMVMRLGHLSEYEKSFHPVLYKVLEKAYEVFPDKELLGNICKYIMKGQPVQKKYFKWYSLAVENDIRITGLYEYYISTMPKGYQPVLPQVIRMYFVYNNSLGSNVRAAVYANVIKNKNIDKVTYQNYKENMEEFARECLEQGRISEDYAAIYQECIGKLTDEKLAEQMSKLMFSYRLYCDDPKIRNVVVCHRELAMEEVYPCSDGVAYIRMYTDSAQIFFEDEKKRRYFATVEYNIQKLMDETVHMDECMALGSGFPGFLLSVCGTQEKIADINADNFECFQNAAKAEELRMEYRHKICGKILKYYAAHADDYTLDSYLRNMDYLTFAQVDKVLLTELLIDKGMYERAFTIISQYGYEGISVDKLVKMISRTILRTEFIEHEDLVYLSMYVFEQGKYDDIILQYLSDNLLGPVEKMGTLWEKMQGFSLDTYALEEEILLLSMFGRVHLSQGDNILESYIRQKGKGQVILAYLSFEAYRYFLGGCHTGSFIMKCLEKCYEENWEVDKICHLALLKYYSEQKELTEKQMKNISGIMGRCNEEGLRFQFFQNLPPCFTKSYQLDDKKFVEEKFPQGSRVTIHYTFDKKEDENTEYKSEPVKNMYQGIFVKEFLLFYGEKISYYLTVETEDETYATEEKTLVLEDTFREGKTRYQLLNQILSGVMLDQNDKIESSMTEYLKRESMVEKLFPLIH